MVMDRRPRMHTAVGVALVARTKAKRVASVEKDKPQRRRMLAHHGRNSRGQQSVDRSMALKGEGPLATDRRIGMAAKDPRLLPTEVRVECGRTQTCRTRRIINAQDECSFGHEARRWHDVVSARAEESTAGVCGAMLQGLFRVIASVAHL